MSNKKKKGIPRLDFSDFKTTPEIFGAKNEASLKTNYGAERTMPIQPVTEPLSPTAALTKAGEEVLKMQKKGFRCNIDPNTRPYEIYKDSLVPLLKEQVQEQQKEEKDKVEKHQQFWHSTNFVKRTIREIGLLPFPNEVSKLIYQNKFKEGINTIVRKMSQLGLLEPTHVKPDDKQKSMIYFITEGKKLRSSLFKHAIEAKLFKFSQMRKSHQKEFVEFDSRLNIKPSQLPKIEDGFNPDLNNNNESNLTSNETPTSSINRNTSNTNFTNHNYNNNNSKNNNINRTPKKAYNEADYDRSFLVNSIKKVKLPGPYRPVLSQLTKESITKEISKNKRMIKRLNTALSEAISDTSKFGSGVKLAQTTPVSPRNIDSIDDIFYQQNLIKLHKVPEVITQPFTRHNSPRSSTSMNKRRRRQSPTNITKIGPRKNGEIYWKYADPLNTRSGGYVDQIQSLYSITNLELGVQDSLDEKLSKPVIIPFNMISQEPSLSDLNNEKNDHKNDNTKNNEEEGAYKDCWKSTPFDNESQDESIEVISTNNNQMNIQMNKAEDRLFTSSIPRFQYYSNATDNESKERKEMIEFLDKMSYQMKYDVFGQELHNQLNEIWDHLGFTFQNKIQMMIKYSENPESCDDLSDSLPYWELIKDSFDRYDSVYKELKEVLKMFTDTFDQKAIDRLISDYKEAKAILEGHANTLFKTFGDDVILKRKRANDFMACRTAKLNRMLFSAGQPIIEMDD